MNEAGDPSGDAAPREPFAVRLRSLLGVLAQTADSLTREVPRWLRPFARLALFAGFLLFGALTLPFLPLFRRSHVRFLRDWEAETAPVRALRLRAQRLWVEDSPLAAAAHVRSVFDRLRASREGVDVPPYGRFGGVLCLHDLASAAYEYELSAGRPAHALEVAELMCAEHDDGGPGLGDTWVVSRAKCLVRLGRVAEAKELLVAHRSLHDAGSEVNRYLEELRSGGR